MAKKKKASPEEKHRQIQDYLQYLPYAIAQQEKEGKRFRVLLLRYVQGPMLRLMNRFLERSRYRGPEGAKLRQKEQMKRHLEQKQKALQHVQGELRKAQQKNRKRR